MKTLILLFLLTSNAYASLYSMGNGGDVLVCKKNDQKKRITLLEYWEWKQRNKTPYSYEDSNLSYEEILDKTIARIKTIDPLRGKYYLEKANMFKTHENVSFESGITLRDDPDHQYLNIPKHCQVEQIATLTDRFEGRTVINKDLWDQLSSFNQAGLVLHLIILNEIRENSIVSSAKVRNYNGFLATDILSASGKKNYVRHMINMRFYSFSYFAENTKFHLGTKTRFYFSEFPFTFYENGMIKSFTLHDPYRHSIVNGVHIIESKALFTQIPPFRLKGYACEGSCPNIREINYLFGTKFNFHHYFKKDGYYHYFLNELDTKEKLIIKINEIDYRSLEIDAAIKSSCLLGICAKDRPVTLDDDYPRKVKFIGNFKIDEKSNLFNKFKNLTFIDDYYGSFLINLETRKFRLRLTRGYIKFCNLFTLDELDSDYTEDIRVNKEVHLGEKVYGYKTRRREHIPLTNSIEMNSYSCEIKSGRLKSTMKIFVAKKNKVKKIRKGTKLIFIDKEVYDYE